MPKEQKGRTFEQKELAYVDASTCSGSLVPGKRNNYQKVSGFLHISGTFSCFTSETEASGKIICFPSRDKTNLRYYVKSI